MFKWITCYLSGRHDFKVSREPGVIFLSCQYCGRRSTGWELRQERELAQARLEVGRPVQVIASSPRGAR
jgi:hypothetical protein